MFNFFAANWQLLAVAAGLLLILAPRVAHLLPTTGGWFETDATPSQDDLVHAYRLLLDHLDDAPAQGALTDAVWPAIGRYRT